MATYLKECGTANEAVLSLFILVVVEVVEEELMRGSIVLLIEIVALNI